MKKLVSLALALVLILGVTAVPASAIYDVNNPDDVAAFISENDHPAGWEGLTWEDFFYRECICDEAHVPNITYVDYGPMFRDLGLKVDRVWFDNNTHIVGFNVRDKASGDLIRIDLRHDKGKALYTEYEAKWQAMKNGETAVDVAPVATVVETPVQAVAPISVVEAPVTATAPAVAAAFPDVAPDAWYAEAVNAMTDAGIIKGDGNGNFRPDDTVTYGEFVTILARIANLSTEVPDDEEHSYVTMNCYGVRLIAYTRDHLPHWATWANSELETAIWNDKQMIANLEDLDCDVVRGHALSVIYRTMKYVGLDLTPVNDYTEADIPDWNETVGVDNGYGNNIYYIDDQLHFLPDEFIYPDFRKEARGYVTSLRTGYNMEGNDYRGYKYSVKGINPAMKPYVAANPYDVLAMYNLGVTEGVDAAHTCAPLRTMTRAELCVLLQRAGLDHVFTK